MLRYLYGDKAAGAVQMIFEFENGSQRWCPGNAPYHPSSIQGFRYLGLTGKVFESYSQNQFQPCTFHWCGVDIDGWNDWEKIPKSIPCTIRSSRSGRGLHLIFRFEEPIQVPAGKPCLTPSVKASLAPWLPQLFEICGSRALIGKGIDKADYRNFWLFGGKNKTLRKHPRKIKGVFVQSQPSFLTRGSLNVSGGLIQLLRDGNVLPSLGEVPNVTQIWVKQVFELLKGTPWEFETASPMRSTTWHVNGCLFIKDFDSYYEVSIFTNADNKVVRGWVFPKSQRDYREYQVLED